MADLIKKATRESYGEALAELGDKYENLYVLDADLAGATKTGVFKKKFPDKHKVLLKDLREHLSITDAENKKYFSKLGY